MKALAAAVRAGNDIVVPQPTCGYVLRKDYLDYVGGAGRRARWPPTRTTPPSTSIRCTRARAPDSTPSSAGDVPAEIAYHAPCHLRAQNIGLKSRDLLRLTGARVTVVQQCSGIDGMWGLRAENDRLSIPIGQKLAAEIEQAGGDVVAGDCHLANTAITEQTGRIPQHPCR